MKSTRHDIIIKNRKRRISLWSKATDPKVNEDVDSKKSKLAASSELDPFQIDRAFATILNYLDIQSLKTARLVNRHWAKEAGKAILCKSYLSSGFSRIPPTITTGGGDPVVLYKTFLKECGPFSRVLKMSLNSIEKTKVFKFIPQLADQVRELKVRVPGLKERSGHSCLECFEYRRKLLFTMSSFRYLKVLDMNYFFNLEDEVLQGTEYVYYKDKTSRIKSSVLKAFLEKIRYLKELRLNFNLAPSTLESFKPYYKDMKAIRKLQMNNENRSEILEMLTIFDTHEITFPITHLSFTLTPSMNMDLTKRFLHKFSKTLKQLEVTMDWTNSKVNDVVVWNNLTNVQEGDNDQDVQNWFIPATLTSLEVLKFSAYGSQDQQCDSVWWKSLIGALQLPRLKKLTLEYLPSDLEKRIETLRYSKAPKKRVKPHSLSLEELELNSLDNVSRADFTALTLSGFWPRLKFLKMTIPFRTIFHPVIFIHWNSFQSLDLTFNFHPSDEMAMHMYEDWLIGAQHPKNYRGGEVIPVSTGKYLEDKGFYLYHLDNLLHLTIRGTPDCPLEPPFTDFLVHNCFKFMCNLWTLRFIDVEVGDKALKVLKESLEPRTAVIFGS